MLQTFLKIRRRCSNFEAAAERWDVPGRSGVTYGWYYYLSKMLAESAVARDIWVTIITFGASMLLLWIWEQTARLGIFHRTLNRKVVHVTFGLVFMLFWPLFSSDQRQSAFFASSIPGINIVRMLLMGLGLWKDEATVKSFSRNGDYRYFLCMETICCVLPFKLIRSFPDLSPLIIFRELLRGPLCYAISLTLGTLYWRTSPISIAAICNMCAGDGVADIIGRRLGAHKLPYNRSKSYAGSIAMATAGFVASLGFMRYFSLFGYIEESWTMVFDFFVLSLAAAFVESLPTHPMIDDNISVVLASIVLGILLF